MTDDDLSLRQIAELASQRHGGARGRALERELRKMGSPLSFTLIDQILNGTYRSTPKAQTLDALAKVAGVSREVVFRAAGIPLPQAPFAEQLPPDSDLLTPKQRDAVLAVVRQFVQAQKALYGVETTGGGERNAEHPAPTKTPAPGPANQPGKKRSEFDVAAHEEPHTIASEQEEPDTP